MKILQVVSYFHPAYAFGGPIKVAYQISRELVKRKHEVVVYTSDAKDLNSRLSVDPVEVVDGIKVWYMRNLGLIPLKTSKLFITPRLVSSAREELEKFDLIHLHEYRTFQNIFVRHYAKKYGIPYVLQAHGTLPRIMSKQRLKRIYDVFFGYRLLRDASKVIALSKMEAEQYRVMGVPEPKIEVVPNGIDLSEYANLPPKGSFKKKFSIDDDDKIVLYLGRIHESKGLDLLAHAFNILTKDLSNVRLVLVGPDDGYAAMFSKLIADLGLEEKVLLTGYVDERSKLAALVESDVFVTPRFYGFPVTFLEACLAGCPIATASNELDWIHDNVGYVVENSPVALAKAISNIIQNEDVYKEFRNNCRQTIERFNISRTVSLIEKIYEEIVI